MINGMIIQDVIRAQDLIVVSWTWVVFDPDISSYLLVTALLAFLDRIVGKTEGFTNFIFSSRCRF
jgi:hypothetical protein